MKKVQGGQTTVYIGNYVREEADHGRGHEVLLRQRPANCRTAGELGRAWQERRIRELAADVADSSLKSVLWWGSQIHSAWVEIWAYEKFYPTP